MGTHRRREIRMDDAELMDFIDAQRSLRVGTIAEDGQVHLSTLWFALIDDRIVFETYTSSQKIKDLQRDPRITLLLEDGDVYGNLRGAMIKGRAVLVQDPDRVQPMAVAVLRRNQPELPEALLDEAASAMAAKRTAVVVEPDHVVSWDHTKL